MSNGPRRALADTSITIDPIAATAARHGLALLTRNGDDFAGLDSAVEVLDLT